jgi:hypothetical protein
MGMPPALLTAFEDRRTPDKKRVRWAPAPAMLSGGLCTHLPAAGENHDMNTRGEKLSFVSVWVQAG